MFWEGSPCLRGNKKEL